MELRRSADDPHADAMPGVPYAAEYERLDGSVIKARSGHTVTFVEHLNLAVIYGGLGSEGSNHYLNDVVFYDTVRQEAQLITPEGSPPPPTFGHTALLTTVDGLPAIWIFGGLGRRDRHETASNVLVLRPDGAKWEPYPLKGEVIIGRWGHSVVKRSDDTAVLFGGMVGNYDASSDLFLIDLQTRKVTKVEYLEPGIAPEGRRRHTAVLYEDNFMFMFGGRAYDHWHGDMWVYNIQLNRWIMVINLVNPVDLRNWYRNPGRVDIYEKMKDVLVNAFQSRESMETVTLSGPMFRTGSMMFIDGHTIFVSTGFTWNGASVMYNDLWAYHILEHRWYLVKKSLTPMEIREKNIAYPLPGSMASLTPFAPGKALFLGGRFEDSATNEMFVLKYSSSPRPFKAQLVQWLEDACFSGNGFLPKPDVSILGANIAASLAQPRSAAKDFVVFGELVDGAEGVAEDPLAYGDDEEDDEEEDWETDDDA